MIANSDLSSLDLANEASINCACFQVRKLARIITREYDAALDQSGLKITQFTILASIVLSAEGKSLTDLANQLAMDRSTFSRNINPLIKQGYVEYLDTLKGRGRNVQATQLGKKVFVEAAPAWQTAQKAIRQKFEQANQADFLETLGAVAWSIRS